MKHFKVFIAGWFFSVLIITDCLGQIETDILKEVESIILPKIDVLISTQSDLIEGLPIVIKCEIINKGNTTQRFDFTERHHYHKKLPYATCITASVHDMNDRSLCKFGTQYVIWSTLFTEKDKKNIKLRPGKKIVRELNICEISYDCSCDFKEGFKKGKYKIRVYVHSVSSNALEIEIK